MLIPAIIASILLVIIISYIIKNQIRKDVKELSSNISNLKAQMFNGRYLIVEEDYPEVEYWDTTNTYEEAVKSADLLQLDKPNSTISIVPVD